MKRIPLLLVSCAVLGAALPSCETGTQTGALAGAATGAALGAILDDDNRGRGAAVGAAAGAAVGGISGAVADARAQQYNPGASSYPQPNYGGYPYATRTNRGGYVRSPHPPHNTIDVTGYAPGTTVVDPTTNKPFRVP